MDQNEKMAELMVNELAAQVANQAIHIAQLKATLAIVQGQSGEGAPEEAAEG